MVKHVLLVLVLSSTAHAQAVTPTVVAAPNVAAPQVAPWIARKGNLRVSIACAESWATPDGGLQLSVDGAAIDPQRVNGRWSSYVDGDGNTGTVWSSTDTGYLLAPGRHHVQIDAPGCAPSAFDLDADPIHADHAFGRLAVDDWSLGGTVGAPNGWGLSAGMWFGSAPMGPTSNAIFMQNASYDTGHTETGGYLSSSLERRNFTLAFDLAFASGSTSGTVSGSTVFGGASPQGFTGSVYDSIDQLRVGARLPLQYVALSAGSGLGIEWWFNSTQLVGSSTSGLFSPDGADASFYLPVWASATIKPSCDWGVQLLGQYDVHPTSMDTNGFTLAAGIMFQPSAACSEPAGVRVASN